MPMAAHLNISKAITEISINIKEENRP